MLRFIRQFIADESGPTAVEYGVMLAMIAAACIASVNLMAASTAQSFNTSAGQLAGVLGS